MNDTIPESPEGVIESENNLNNVLKYVVIIMVGISLSQLVTIEFFRGIVEISLAIASYYAYQRSKSPMIQNVTLIAVVVLTVMGVYDILSAIG